MAHPRLKVVRELYSFRCGYCGVSEADVGGELTVDHFHPVTAGGGDCDENLVYACVRCNQYKGALLSGVTDPAASRRILHPLKDDLRAHLREDSSTGRLHGLTSAGRFHITALRLNRPPLVANRQRRQLVALLEARLEQALAENAQMIERLARSELYIAYLEKRLEKIENPENSE